MSPIVTNMTQDVSPKLKIERLNELRATEKRLNNHLFLVSAIVTGITMAMMTLAFLSRGAFPSVEMSVFYLGVVIVYSFHNELVRWLGEDKIIRQGEYFVYGWIGLTVAFYTLDFLTNGYFSTASDGRHLDTIKESAALTFKVLIIFLLTRGLKFFSLMIDYYRGRI